jgi:hypothetical protein
MKSARSFFMKQKLYRIFSTIISILFKAIFRKKTSVKNQTQARVKLKLYSLEIII